MMKNNHILPGVLLGCVTGGLLFCIESFFIILSGSRIPLSYLTLTFSFDVLGGLVLGLIAGVLSTIAIPFLPAKDEDRRFDTLVSILILLLAFSLGFFFLHGRILAGSRFYEWRGLFFTFCLMILCLILVFSLYRLFPRVRNRYLHVYPSCLSEIMFLETLALSYLWLNEDKLVGCQQMYALFMNVLFIFSIGVCYVLLSLLFSKWMSRRAISLEKGSLTFSLVMALIAMVGISLFWSFSYFHRGPSFSAKSSEERTPKKHDPHFNIILISVDTLRASSLSCYGYPLETTPYMDRFAKDALIFTNAVSSSSWTLPAHASLFTGLVPYRHGAHYADRSTQAGESVPLHELDMVGVQPLPSKQITLAEVLKEDGYTNVAFVSNFAALSHSLGLAQGFDIYEDRERTWVTFRPFYHRILRTLMKDFGLFQDFVNRRIKPFRSAEEISNEAIRWLKESREEPFFLFLNYMEPHTPYLPYPPFHKRFLKKTVISMKDPFWEVMANHRPLREDERDYLLSQYDGEVAYADVHIGRLFDFLRSIGLYDTSMIVFLSDHGELFGEHNLLRHTGLYEEVLKIPLIVKYPFSERTGRDNERVGIVDVMPEILNKLGMTYPDHMDGAPFEKRDINPLAELYVNPYYHKEFGERFGDILRAKYQGPFRRRFSGIEEFSRGIP